MSCSQNTFESDELAAAVITAPLVIERGVSCERTFSVEDADGDALNLTSYTPITASLYEGTIEEPGDLVLEISLANSRLALNNPTLGEVDMTLSGAVTAAITAGDYLQWFYLTAPSGTVLFPWVRYVKVVPTAIAP